MPFTVPDSDRVDSDKPSFTAPDDEIIKPAASNAADDLRLPPISPAGPLKERPSPTMFTTIGGNPVPADTYDKSQPERLEDIKTGFTAPAIPIPKFKINPDDSKTAAVGKEVVNLALGIPEFAESPAGLLTLPVGGVAPKLTMAAFSANALNDVGKTALDAHKNWDAYTPSQKAAAVTDIVGGGALATILGKGALSKAKSTEVQNADTVKIPIPPDGDKASGTAQKVAGGKPSDVQQAPAAQTIQTTEASVPEINKPLTPRDAKDVPVTIQRADGTSYEALARGGPTEFMGKQGIARMQESGKLSDGVLGDDEKIAPKTEITPENPPVISESGPKVKQEAAASKREKILSDYENKLAAVKNEAEVDDSDADQGIWSVYGTADGNDRQATVSKDLEGFIVENEHGSGIAREKSLEDAIQAAKWHVEGGENQEVYNLDQDARGDIIHTIELPDDFSIKEIQDTKWGSVYYLLRKKIGEDAEGEPEYEDYKVSIRDHEPSPFREKEFGSVDAWYEVPKNPTPKQLSDAVAKVEDFAKRNSSGFKKPETSKKEAGASNVIPGQVENKAAIPRVQSEPSRPAPVPVQPNVGQPEIFRKYRVGNNPTLHTVVEKLPASDVEIQNGEQPVKVKNEKTGEVSTVLESDLTAVKEATTKPKKQSLPDKLKALGYSDSEIAAMPKSGQKAIADRGFPKGQQSRGPGAAAVGEPGTYSAIQQLADQLEATAKDNAPVNEKVSAIEKAKQATSDAKESVEGSLSNVVAISKALWKSYSELSPFTDMKRIVGRWFYANQKADHEAREFGRQIVKAVPDKTRREAITNWIQADGDVEVLKAREAASKGALARGYKIAQSLTTREIEIAQLIREYYDRQLEKGISEGLLREGLDNYITQVWKRENPVTRKLINELVNSKLQPNFKFARKRIFDSYFEGEQAGYVPRTKDAGALVANYDQSFNKALAARAFIKELHEGKASDGRPLVELSGSGSVVEQTGERSLEQPKSILINPKAKPEEISDYRTIDHPALRGWKFAATSPDGAAVLLKGDMLVHPEVYAKLKNRLSTSWFRQHPVPRAILSVQSTFKQSLMSISGFHQVQEGLHALGHRVNPMSLEKIDYSDPVTKAGVEHGLQLSDYNALEQFGEGLSSGKLLNKVPFLGPKLKAYNDWLFQDHIPRLKLTMFKHALERNQERYAAAIKAGKITPDQVIELTASQANHAFGELPYKYWGRNPNLQDFYRTFLLAPDFLEARAGFVGQAASPGGLGAKGLLKNEQLQALAVLALTQYMTARIVNQVVDKDPHFELKNAFRIISGNHAYSLRTVPGDIIHLISDPRGFSYNRLSPIVGRGGIELATSRDYRGVKRNFIEQMQDLLKSGIPISLNHKYGQNFWETLGNAFGLQNQRYDAVQNIHQKIADWKSANNIKDPVEMVYNPDEDKFAPLRTAIFEGREGEAQKQFDELKKTVPVGKIKEHFALSLNKPLTGSKANDMKFYNILSEVGKEEWKEALDLRKARLKAALSLK